MLNIKSKNELIQTFIDTHDSFTINALRTFLEKSHHHNINERRLAWELRRFKLFNKTVRTSHGIYRLYSRENSFKNRLTANYTLD